MFDILKQISSIPSINGSEYLLSRFLKKYFEEKNFAVTSVCGNTLLVRRDSGVPKSVVFAPLDHPGFICLYREKDNAFLTPTSPSLKNCKTLEAVKSFSGEKFDLEISENEPKTYSIRASSAKLGDAFTPCGEFEISEGSVSGWNASRYACISLLTALAETVQNSNVAFCFTEGFNTSSKSESNVIARYGVENAIFLGYTEDNEAAPLLLLKDGKRFSSSTECEKLQSLCKEQNLRLCEKVSDDAVTAAERTFSPSLKTVLSIALPCTSPLSEKETVQMKAMADLYSALELFLNDK